MAELTPKERFEQRAAKYRAVPEFAPEASEVAPEMYGPPAPTPAQQRLRERVERYNLERQQGTAIALEAAKTQNPELYRKAQEISGLQDLPPDVVYRNIEQFQEREKLDAAREVLRTNPTLMDWFQHADNAKTVEVENLAAVNGMTWAVKAGSRALTQGGNQVDVAEIRWKQMFGLASPEEILRADQMENSFTDDFGGASWLGRGFTGALSNLPIMGTIVGEGIEGAGIGAAIGGAAGSIVPGIGTLAGAGTGMSVGFGIGSFRESMRINSALAFSEYSRFRTSDGKKLDRDTAAGAALIAGGLMAGLDTASLGVLMKATGIGTLLSSYGPKYAVKEALKDKAFLAIAAQVGKRFAGAIGAETVTESIQEAIQIAGGEISKAVQSAEGKTAREFINTPGSEFTGDFKPITFGQAFERITSAGRDAALATAFLGIVPMGGRLAVDYASANRQVSETARINQLVEFAKKDALVKKSPEKAAEVAAASLQGSDKDTVYIDTDSIKQFMQEEDSPELAALSRVPEFQRRLQEAVQTGGDVAIPTSDFYAYVAASDAAANIVDKLKFAPDGMSKKEAEAFIKALESIRDKEIPVGDPVTTVSTDIYEKTRKAGATPDQARSYAALYGAFFDSMAAQTGRTPEDIYKAYNLDILQQDANPTPDALNTFDQAAKAKLPAKKDLKRVASVIDKIYGSLASKQVMPHVIEMIQTAGSAKNALAAYDLPEQFAPLYKAALEAVHSITNPTDSPIDPLSRAAQNITSQYLSNMKHIGEAVEDMRGIMEMYGSLDDLSAEGYTGDDKLGWAVAAHTALGDYEDYRNGTANIDFDELLEQFPAIDKLLNGPHSAEIKKLQEAYAKLDSGASGNYSALFSLLGSTMDASSPLEGEAVPAPTLKEGAFEQKQPTGGKTLRGAITFSPDKTTIRLFRNANLSTLLHESGHLFLQVMSDLVQGKRAYGGQLFQDDDVKPGDFVNLYNDEGEAVGPFKVTGVVPNPTTGKVQFTVEGGKGIYDAERAIIVSGQKDVPIPTIEEEVVEPERQALEEQEEGTEEPGAPALLVGESPVEDPAALGSASSPVDLSPEDSSYYGTKFGLILGSNTGFRKFVEGKPQTTATEKRDLLFAYFPRSKEAVQYLRSKTARAQNEDPKLISAAVSAGITPRGGKKANPLGVQTEEIAALNIDDTITHAGSIIQATAKLNTALSGKQSNKILTALRMSLRKMRKGSEAGEVNAAAWDQLEQDLQLVQPGQVFPDEVKRVVNEYIALYKKDTQTREAKAASKAKREGQQAAKQVEEARSEDVAAAIAELSTVVERVEKIEQQKEARQQLIDDMKTLRAWLGEEGPVFSTKAHEQFAVAFEAYLFEGVAPNEGLRRAFDRFKTWLKLVYRKITNIGVRPTPEVRAVFDRVLTIDKTVQNEIQSPAFQPSFSSPEEMGVSQAEFDEYMARVNSLAEVGREAAEKVAVGEASKLRTKAVQQKRKELRAKHKDDLTGQRVYRVINYLQGNKLGGANGLDPVKLDRKRVEQIVGRGKLNTIPNGHSMWAKEGGVEPNTVATMFGYNSAAEMLAEIQSVDPMKVEIEARVERDMASITDEQLVTPPEVAEMTEAKLRSEVYQDFLKTEIRTFSKLMGLDFTEAHVAQFKRMADDIIEDKTVRNVGRYNFMREYIEADRKIGKLLDTAIKKKRYDDILDLRRKQFFNSFLIQRAYAAKSKQTDAVKYLKSFSKSKSNIIDQDYLTQIRNLTIGLNLVRGQQDPNAPAFSRFLDDELDSGQMIIIDPRVKSKRNNKAYLHLSHGEFMAVYDAVKNLDFVGRTKRQIFKEGKVLDLNKAVELIADAMDRNLIPPKELATLNRRGLDRLTYAWQTYIAGHVKIEQLCDWIDGRAAQGPAHKYIFQPMADAQARAYEMSKQYGQKLLEIINKKPSDYWSEEYVISEVSGKRFKRSEMLAIALNMGNESNLKKLKKGMGWTDVQLQAVTSRLDKADWEIAQQIWDTIDGLWPSVIEVAARTGIPRPDKVEAVEFTNEHGTFRGGYYPIVYDPSKSADALARGLTTKAEQQFGFQPHSIFPSKSFANDRDNEYARPMFLDMTALPNHVSKVIHYVTHAEAAYNVQKILSHSKFKDRLLAQFGEAMFGNIKGWIENITRGEVDPAGLGAASAFMRRLRQNISLAALGFRTMTVVAQAGGLFAGAEMIGLRGVARGLSEMYGSASIEKISANFDFVRSKSPEMRNRTQFLDRDLNDMSEAFQSRGTVRWIKELAMKPMMLADQVVATSVWMGAYTREITRNPHDEATAVAYADKVVRLTQGAAGAKDLAAYQRGSEFFKMFTMFYTYFAAMQNRLIDIARTARYRMSDAPEIQGLDTPNEVMRYMYLIVLPSLTFDFLMKGALQGDFDEDQEKDKSLLASALWKVVSYSLAGFVGIRDLASFVGRDGFEWRYGGPPVTRNVAMTIERMNRMISAAQNEDRDVKILDLMRTAIDVAGYTTGAPIDAPTLIMQNYLKAQEKGEEIGLADFFVRR